MYHIAGESATGQIADWPKHGDEWLLTVVTPIHSDEKSHPIPSHQEKGMDGMQSWKMSELSFFSTYKTKQANKRKPSKTTRLPFGYGQTFVLMTRRSCRPHHGYILIDTNFFEKPLLTMDYAGLARLISVSVYMTRCGPLDRNDIWLSVGSNLMSIFIQAQRPWTFSYMSCYRDKMASPILITERCQRTTEWKLYILQSKSKVIPVQSVAHCHSTLRDEGLSWGSTYTIAPISCFWS